MSVIRMRYSINEGTKSLEKPHRTSITSLPRNGHSEPELYQLVASVEAIERRRSKDVCWAEVIWWRVGHTDSIPGL